MIGYVQPDYPLVAAFRALPPARTRPADRLSRRIFKLAPKLADYLPAGAILASKGDLDRPISGLAIDSRRVMPGNLFFALPGRGADGQAAIEEAIQRGAVAIVAERLPALTAARVTYVQVAAARRTLADVARRYFRSPDQALDLVGVAGTSGRTAVACLLRHLLATPGRRVGLLGAIHYDLGPRIVPSYRTTPEAPELHGLLAQMLAAGCREAVLEISASGLEQQRVHGLQLGVAVFTDLSGDSPENPGSSVQDFALKARLFTGAGEPLPRVAVLNADDAHGRRLAGLIPPTVRLITFGESPAALIRAEDVRLDDRGATFRLIWPGGALAVASPLLGRGNVSTLLAAFAAGFALGRDPATLAPRLAGFPGVPGRLERVGAGRPCTVLVDYASTVEALREALGVLRPLTPGRLLVVFGCGGHRDRGQRPHLTAAVQAGADLAWATANNPRSEPLEQIFADMQAGVQAADRITFVTDRRRALSLALAAARPGDTLLVAGKGHETAQELADTVVPFDDRQVLRELLARPTLPPA